MHRKSGIQKELDEALLRKKEIEEKARKRTRGPYRKSSVPPVAKRKES